MKKYLILAAAGAAYLFYRLRNKANMLSKLTFSFVSVNVKSNFDLLSVLKIQLVFEVRNITNQSLTINTINADISVNGINLGQITDNNIVIEPNGNTKISIMIDTFTVSLLQTVLNILNSKQALFKIKGYASVAAVSVPFEVEKKFL